MHTSIVICNHVIGVSITNDRLFDYIRNRYIGFVAECSNATDDFRVIDISEQQLKIDYGIGVELDNIEKILKRCDHRDEYYYLADQGTIVYDQARSICGVYIAQSLNSRLTYLFGVTVCNIIIDYLADCNIFCMHSSIVSFKHDLSNGIAFLGSSGVGKTSLAYEFIKKGEKITNDDVSYFRLYDDHMRVYKNTQYIGMDDESIKRLYPECEVHVVKKDGLELDKNRINLSEMNKNAYAQFIDLKRVVIVSPERSGIAELKVCNEVVAFKNLFKAMTPFLPPNKIVKKRIVERLLGLGLEFYELTPANSAFKTVESLYEIFK